MALCKQSCMSGQLDIDFNEHVALCKQSCMSGQLMNNKLLYMFMCVKSV